MTMTWGPDPLTVDSRLSGPLIDVPVHVELGYYPEGADVSRWDVARWDTDGIWEGVAPREDITCNVTDIKINRGRDLPLERFRPSSATVTVYDPEGKWSPWRNALEPTYSSIRPGMDLFVWADLGGGVRTYRFTGIVDAITDTYTAPGDNASHMVTFQVLDYLSILAAYDSVEQALAGSGEMGGARLHRIADNADYLGPRSFDTGSVPLQPTTLAKSALDEAGMTVDTEQGAFWCTREGVLKFRDRNGLGTEPLYTTVQATFGEVEPEICYTDIVLASDAQKIKNIVSIANVDGVPVTLADDTSIALYRPRTYKRTDLIHLNGADSALMAQRQLDFFANAQNRIDGLGVNLGVLTHDQRLTVLALGALHMIRVLRRAEGFQVAADLQIQGIAEAISPTEWTITFATFSANAVFEVAEWDSALWDSPTAKWGY
jgi:hypothetical protein